MKAPRSPAAPSLHEKAGLHPRNRHRYGYDFSQLCAALPELSACVQRSPRGDATIDFSDPHAVLLLNRALLKTGWGIAEWDLPPGALCPPIPGRADYLHHAADLLAEENRGVVPTGTQVRVLDIGVGANLIYPILGHCEYGWQFVGTDIALPSLQHAQSILDRNPPLSSFVELRHQRDARRIFAGVLHAADRFHLTMCNPPFHASAAAAIEGNVRKRRNLGLSVTAAQHQGLNFGGQAHELWCEGGEAAFVAQMIRESEAFAAQVLWFTCLISKSENLRPLQKQLSALPVEQRVVPMAQGQKQSRFLAWTFLA